MTTIQQLKLAHLDDLKACQTSHERLMCRAINGKQIRDTAEQLAEVRSLTLVERAIAAEFGWKPTDSTFPVELTPIGEQYVIPGTERNASPRVKQLNLFGG